MDNNVVGTNDYEHLMKKNRKDILKQVSLTLMVVAILLIGGGFGYLIYLNTSPVKVYQTAVTSVIDDMFNGLYQDYDKTNITVSLSANLNLTAGLIEQEIIDYINETTISFNTQFNEEKQQMVVKIDSDHDNESLIDLAMFLNAKDEKTYLYAKDYFDKYLEVEMDDYTTFKKLFEELEMTSAQKANAKKAKDILKKEISKLITNDDCHKKDGAFVFEITDRQWKNKLQTLFKNLKNNKVFLDCYEDSETVKAFLEAMSEEYEGNVPTTDVAEQKMIITMNKGMFSTGFDKLTIDVMGVKLLFENKDDKTTYEVSSNNMKILEGYFKNIKEKNTEKTEISLNISELGSATLYVDTTVLKNAKIETVDASKTVKLEELSEDEMSEIMTKIEESPLYKFILMFKVEEDNDHDYDNDYDWGDEESECTGIIEYDGVSVELDLPSNFRGAYCISDFGGYYVGDISVNYSIWAYDSYNDYFEEIKEGFNHQEDNPEYQNRILSDVKTKIKDGRTYYYIDYTFDYVFYGTSKAYEKYICTEIEKGYYLTIEIESWDEPITESIVKEALSIK